MPIEKIITVRLDTAQAQTKLGVLKKDIESSADVTEQIGKNAEGSVGGFQKLTISTKAFGTALKATGIGLVVGAFVKLQEALGRNQKVMDTFNIVTETISLTFQELVHIVVKATQTAVTFFNKVGNVIKKFVKQDLDGLTSSYEENNEQVESSIQRNRRLAQEIVNLRNEVKLAEAEQRLLQLTYQKEAEIQRQIRDDISLTFEERIAANTKLGEILDAQFEEEQALAEKKLELAELELSKNRENIDLQVAVINAKTELADLDERITGQRSEQLVNLTALQKEYNDAVKEFGTLKAVEVKEIETNADTADGIMKKALKGYKKLKKQEVEVDELTNEDKLHMTATSMGQIAGLLGEDSKAGKALAISQALINTYLGATKAIGQGGIFGVIAAAGVIASGLATVRQIRNTKLPDLPNASGGGGGGVSAPSLPNIEMPDEEGAGGIGGLIPNLGNIEGATEPQPVQAYVVENEISNSQALQEELELQATL